MVKPNEASSTQWEIRHQTGKSLCNAPWRVKSSKSSSNQHYSNQPVYSPWHREFLVYPLAKPFVNFITYIHRMWYKGDCLCKAAQDTLYRPEPPMSVLGLPWLEVSYLLGGQLVEGKPIICTVCECRHINDSSNVVQSIPRLNSTTGNDWGFIVEWCTMHTLEFEMVFERQPICNFWVI